MLLPNTMAAKILSPTPPPINIMPSASLWNLFDIFLKALQDHYFVFG